MLPGFRSVGVGGGAADCANVATGTRHIVSRIASNFITASVGNSTGYRLPATSYPIQMCQAADEDRAVGDRHGCEGGAVELVDRKLLKGLARRNHRRDPFLAEEVDAAVGEDWRRRVIATHPLLPDKSAGFCIDAGQHAEIADDVQLVTDGQRRWREWRAAGHRPGNVRGGDIAGSAG